MADPDLELRGWGQYFITCSAGFSSFSDSFFFFFFLSKIRGGGGGAQAPPVDTALI